MSEWKINNPIDYQNDDVDQLTLKTKETFEQIFTLLNTLRSGNATAGLDAADATAYTLRINTKDGCLYIRNAQNDDWICLGELKENFGITAETIKAIESECIRKIGIGLDANKPTSKNTINDIYVATDKGKMYVWTGSAWDTLLSLDIEDTNYKEKCVTKEEVGYNGKNKILRLDAVTGKGQIDITGSPDRLLNYKIEVQNIKDGDVLVFDEAKQKIVNKPKDALKETDLTVSGEAGKIVKVYTDGKIHATLEGSASQIDGVEVETKGATNGQVLVFENGRLVPKDKDKFTDSDVTTAGEANKLVKVGSDSKIHATLEGSASHIAGIQVDANNIKDGQVFKYDAKRKMLVPAEKDELTEKDVTTTGERNKIAKISSDGTLHATLTGSTSQVGGIKVDISKLQNGYVLAYEAKTDSFVAVPKDVFTKTDVTTTGEKNKLVQVNNDGTVHANVTGSASKINGKNIKITNLSDGDVLTYHSSTQTFNNEPKSAVGAGKSLSLFDGKKHLGDYNGSQTLKLDVKSVVEKAGTPFINHLLRLMENLYLMLEKNNLNNGSDGIFCESFRGSLKNIDQTSALVSNIIKGDDSIDVTDTKDLLIGAHYFLVDDKFIEAVQIKDIISKQRVILTNIVEQEFEPNKTKICRSDIKIENGELSGKNIICITKPILFADVAANKKQLKSQAHLLINHSLVVGANIKAEIALRKNRNDEEKFVEMEKGKTYPEGNNYSYANTEYHYQAETMEEAGCIATIRITTTGNPIKIDSLAVIFNE